ncbi:MAG: endo-1,4-beta-xylanase [Bdellovibrio sp.]
MIRIFFLSTCVLFLGNFAFASSFQSPSQEILNSQYNWRRLSGTYWNGRTLEVYPLGRMIRPKYDESMPWYQNPPINLPGPRLDLSGDFVVEISLDVSAAPGKAASIDLYGTLPVIYDEWRQEGKSVRLTLRNGEFSVWVNSRKMPFSKTDLRGLVKLKLQRQGTDLVFFANDLEVGRFTEASQNAVFDNQKIYFGVDAELGGGFILAGISVRGVRVMDNGRDILKAYAIPADSVRSYAAQLSQPLPIGTSVGVNALFSDPTYGRVLAQNFSMLTPEFDFKFQAIHPRPHIYAFSEADYLVEFALKNNFRIHGHTLVWHEALPSWVWDLYKAGRYSELKQALMEHITSVVGRYKGYIKEWDTLNEIFSSDSNDPEGFRNNAEEVDNISIWYKAFGKQIYIDALRKVKEVDPSCENWINDFGIDQAGSSDKLTNMIKFINYVNNLGYGQLIDGVGFQAHNYDPEEDPAKAMDLGRAMKRVFKEAHIKVRVSELDVNGASARGDLFADKLNVCLRLLGNGTPCSSFGMWGFTDKFGSMGDQKSLGDGLVFDANYRPKEAYRLLQEELQKGLTTK